MVRTAHKRRTGATKATAKRDHTFVSQDGNEVGVGWEATFMRSMVVTWPDMDLTAFWCLGIEGSVALALYVDQCAGRMN